VKAIVATNPAAETAGITLAERPQPTPAINDVVVEVHASGFVPAEWEWPSTWVDRCGHDRAPAIIGHEFAGVVSSLGYGTTGLSLGQRVFGITDWHRDGTLAEYAAVEARNLAPLPGDVEFTVGASLPISGLTAWQGLFQHGRVRAGQSVLAHGAAGAVGSVVTQLAREFGAYVIGTGRAADRQAALDFGGETDKVRWPAETGFTQVTTVQLRAVHVSSSPLSVVACSTSAPPPPDKRVRGIGIRLGVHPSSLGSCRTQARAE